jgi:hypothetical protein
MGKVSSIVDVPKVASDVDLFGIGKYEKGLIEFIRNADTPLTIAIQGEWGSGKTSLMNTLRASLCGVEEDMRNHCSEFYDIWINTWQYSLMNSREETIVSIVSSISTQVMNIISQRHEGAGSKIAGGLVKLFKKGAKVAAVLAADKVVGSSDIVDIVLQQERANTSLQVLREDIQKAIKECLVKDREKGAPQKGFLFFIDDLDRIDPPVAVEILELLKNIFDLQFCIFILAIDYDVVVKGLKPKFGELTDKNEREFRSFFDKLIQMPFSMPVATYSIDNFLISSLKNIGYLPDKKDENRKLFEELSRVCALSVGTNPRSLKRLLNTVSLITIISHQDESAESYEQSENRLILNFALICIQIAYPTLYRLLTLESDFRSWNESLARQLNLKEIKEDVRKKLSDSEEFDEEWEQVLFRICENDNYLVHKATHISQLFNLMYNVHSEDEDLGSVISDLLALSSVTDIQVSDSPSKVVNRGPVLKKFASLVVPLLKSKLREPWLDVKVTSKRIMSNVFIGFSTSLNSFSSTQIGVTVSPGKNQVFIHVWSNPWAFKILGGTLEQDMASLGLSARLNQVKSEYENLPKRHKGLRFTHPPFSKVGAQKGFHVPDLNMFMSFPDIEVLLEKSSLDKITDTITDYMDARASLKKLIEEYQVKAELEISS